MSTAQAEAEREIFEQFIPKLQGLIDFSHQVSRDSFQLTRPLLSFIKAYSEQGEETLDAYGARFNERWFPLRETVALLKNFSTAAYELLHIRQSIGFYGLDRYPEFHQHTEQQISFAANILFRGLCALKEQTMALGIKPEEKTNKYKFTEILNTKRLPKNRHKQYVTSVKQRVDFLSIQILNSTEEVNQFRHLARTSPDDWDKLDFDFLCETKLRSLEVNMHILQSLYDTYISGCEFEKADKSLYDLRGRISVVLHLLRVATIYQHFCERHLVKKSTDKVDLMLSQDCIDCIPTRDFHAALLQFFAHYLAMFLTDARNICSALLQKYCVTKTVEVQAPPYIGFHVRPSSLIAAIVMHYGCNVEMHLGESSYDASIFANIAMANNYLDQKKRAFLSEKIRGMDFSFYEQEIQAGRLTALAAVKEILVQLATQDIIRIYATPLKLTELPVQDSSLATTVFETVKYLMNTDRQVGIVYSAKVSFTGPEQAVDDIAALANANYAESERGEDLPLPPQLDYLNFRRKTIRRPATQN